MKETPVYSLLELEFDDSTQASTFAEELRKLNKQKKVGVADIAIVEKDEKGHSTIQGSANVNATSGLVFGILVGGIIGLTLNDTSFIVSLIVGAVVGGIAASNIDLGISQKDLQRIQELLPNQKSAVIARVEGKEILDNLIKKFQGKRFNI